VLAAAARIAPHAHVTPVLRSRSLDALAGCEIHFKCEQLQRTGAFKFRGACNAVWSLDDGQAARGVVTHSSGNHGAALALAARTRGIACHVVVPQGAVPAKLAAIAGYGAVLHHCAPTIAAREAMCAQVQQATGAELVHPYTDPRVIAGQGTATLELLNQQGQHVDYASDASMLVDGMLVGGMLVDGMFDALVVPVGGGGLTAGTAIAARAVSPGTLVFAAEPSGAADTFTSLQRGALSTDFVPDTVCDGLRGSLGAPKFTLLQAHHVSALTVEDRDTIAAMRLLWQRGKLLVEPSSAIAFAAVLAHRERFAGQRIGIILSGGNVDLDALPQLFALAGS
jgi:threonine dehydratase